MITPLSADSSKILFILADEADSVLKSSIFLSSSLQTE